MARCRGLSLVLVLAFAIPIPAQEQKPKSSIPADGPHVFCYVLHNLGLQPITTLEGAAKNPDDTVIIVLGKPRILDELHRSINGLPRFQRDGGNLLLATDYELRRNYLPVNISGIPFERHDEFAYRGIPRCPRLPMPDPLIAVAGHPIFSLLHKGIATNCPSDLTILQHDGSVRSLLTYPDEPQRPYVAGSPQKTKTGRALYLAGHGMFMNCMLLQTDNDNFEFTKNALMWLRERGDGKERTQALLILDGEIVSDFNMNLTPPPPPPPMPPLKVLGRLFRGLEEERFFHRILGDVMGENAGIVVGILFGVVTFIVLIYAAKKFMEGRHHLETAVPSMVDPEPAMSALAPSEQRQDALLRQRDFWDEARFLVLQWFRHELNVTPQRWRPDVDAEFIAEGFFVFRWRLQNQADEMLRLARSTEPMRLPRSQFFRLVESLKELTAALRDGRLALLVEGKNVRHG